MEGEDIDPQHLEKIEAEFELARWLALIDAIPLPIEIRLQVMTYPDPLAAAEYFAEFNQLPPLPPPANLVE
jgi:hypothetical protein